METILVPWVIAATILLFVAAYWIYTLEKRVAGMEARYQKILMLAEESDQATVAQLLTRLDDQEKRLHTVEGKALYMTKVLPHTIQGCGIVRYRAYNDVGGDQSFSLALVDEHGTGVMVSGLHGHGDVRVYAKPLVEWRSSYSLSAEEQDALGQARQRMREGAMPAPESGA
ncbi:MAG: DUF4446 family protein [Anaerolineales bacterium]